MAGYNKLTRWTDEETNFLKKNYGKILGKDIAKTLNRTYRAIRSKAEKLKLYAPLSDFKNNNPAKIPFILEQIRNFQKSRWNDKNSVLNSEAYRKKQRDSLKLAWKRQDYLKKMKDRDNHCKNLGKVRTQEMKAKYSKSHKILWANPNSVYNSDTFQKELGKRIEDMLQKRGKYIKNNIELKVKDIIHESKLSFIYTGERKIKIERYYPDFINLKKKKDYRGKWRLLA
jgi:hypothetical protein